ncbi:hypothetical protein CABS01_08207 [Colletotrichum abscissum]|nr:uncharacterized protein CABS01_08207 [Colletotrichum abscissum]KAK1508977.1 hypothetical protein CABS01_08207 [Colletotrichum abscissum]
MEGKKGGLCVSRRSFLSRPRRITRNAVEFVPEFCFAGQLTRY